MEIKDYILYDSVTLGSTAKTATLFQQVTGDKSNGYYETNMDAKGQLPTGQKFWLNAIAIKFLPNAIMGDLQAVYAGWFQFLLNQEIRIGPYPIFFVPEFNGILVMPEAGDTGTTVPAIGNGADGRNAMRLDHPFEISSGQQFKCEFTWPTAPNDKTFYWLLIGDLTIGPIV